ncbi:E3 SUMO-protein ligase ZBED1-like [Lasioglossum baleicum]|uniref:E3 SUMO-protein ligase ZBED1-like n=1 Tax=Lasioglossum baleicum TaxID=434251 RepID=UPI003FCEA297
MTLDLQPYSLVNDVAFRELVHITDPRFIALHTALNVMLCEENTPDNLSTDEWNFLKCVNSILEPLKDATEIMSGERYPTISQYFPMYYALMNVLQVQTEENSLIVDISNKVRNALKERFQPIEQDTLYICATVLDPRYKDQMFSCEQKQIMYRKLNEEISINSINTEPTSDKDQESSERKSKLLNFIKNTLGNTERHAETFHSRKDREIAMYLSESVVSTDINIMHWWKSNRSRFPLLSTVARRFLAIPATQVTSERLFSTSGNIVTNTRARLCPDNVEQLCFLHNNLK